MTTVDLAPADSLAIADAGLVAAHGGRLVRETLRGGPAADLLARAHRVHVVAVGKAAVEMGTAVRSAAGPAFRSGVAVPAAPAGPVAGFTVVRGDHPVPGPNSVRAGRTVEEYLSARRFDERDLVVLAVSGGGSALVSRPSSPMELEDLRLLTAALLRTGIDVTRINELRKAVSGIHAGALLPLAGRARLLGLVLSDNVQQGARAVASGLSYPGSVDFARAAEVLTEAAPLLPAPVVARIRTALTQRAATASGTPSILNLEIGSPRTALDAALAAARARGHRTFGFGDTVQGEAREVARRIGAAARRIAERTPGPVCLVGAGEVTVSVRGPGRGGRCQELAWAMLPELAGLPGASFTALATDGQDFLPGVMGARVTGESLGLAAGLGLDWRALLDRNDTHTALSAIGACLPGRPTGTNVCDIYALSWGDVAVPR
ncbi:DUF4147 domain-containing protein [Streptomyces sp. HNM0645]|uniref:DUF4147 domain-containing protein n=1 Tax=Streptomyces sp. HNM0645 TaxID=2782343 RepID=UPI0024B72C53|nr:DUF4147 domain-containing protein [Streptomyces sp. HNM0645]MDI9885572.1 DUF4147 domain-containing protein [Streptomyces sp. HNM0645]